MHTYRRSSCSSFFRILDMYDSLPNHMGQGTQPVSPVNPSAPIPPKVEAGARLLFPAATRGASSRNPSGDVVILTVMAFVTQRSSFFFFVHLHRLCVCFPFRRVLIV